MPILQWDRFPPDIQLVLKKAIRNTPSPKVLLAFLKFHSQCQENWLEDEEFKMLIYQEFANAVDHHHHQHQSTGNEETAAVGTDKKTIKQLVIFFLQNLAKSNLSWHSLPDSVQKSIVQGVTVASPSFKPDDLKEVLFS
jgi:hypothetical protein